MLQPKRTKYQKYQKLSTFKIQSNDSQLSVGTFAIRSCACSRFSAKTIEATRRVITRTLKRQGKIWIRIFPDIPITKKPEATRMGKGKGSVNYWVARIAKGQILFELDGVSKQQAYYAFLKISNKLPFPVKFTQLQ